MSTEETFLAFISRKQELVTALQNNGYMVRWGELAQAVFLNLPMEFGPHYINLQGQNQKSTAQEMVYALENLAKEIGFDDQQPRAKRVITTPAARAAAMPAVAPAVGPTPPPAGQRGSLKGREAGCSRCHYPGSQAAAGREWSCTFFLLEGQLKRPTRPTCVLQVWRGGPHSSYLYRHSGQGACCCHPGGVLIQIRC
jgi:hypothetical protein